LLAASLYQGTTSFGIASDDLRIFPVQKVSAPGGMLLQLTILSAIVASCPDLDAQHL
jgi:hypothetical protein